jgi:protein AbiQ
LKRIYICAIQDDYIQFLKQYDSRVVDNYSGKRKYVGILLELNNQNYYAPLSSPKPKFLKISPKAPDIYKINDGALGVINLNNMIPVPNCAIIRINIEEEPDEKYRSLLRKQAKAINSERKTIGKKASVLYSIVRSGTKQYINSRCCNYPLLEIKCMEYIKEHNRK